MGHRADHRLPHLLRRPAGRRRAHALPAVHDRRAAHEGHGHDRQPRHADRRIAATERFDAKSPELRQAIVQMDQWLTALSKDASNDKAIARIRRAKPAGLVDACWTKDGRRRRSSRSSSTWRGAAMTSTRRTRSRAPWRVRRSRTTSSSASSGRSAASDTRSRCRADEMTRLKKIFPGGVCDWSKPGIDQQPLAGTWQTFNADRGTN